MGMGYNRIGVDSNAKLLWSPECGSIVIDLENSCIEDARANARDWHLDVLVFEVYRSFDDPRFGGEYIVAFDESGAWERGYRYAGDALSGGSVPTLLIRADGTEIEICEGPIREYQRHEEWAAQNRIYEAEQEKVRAEQVIPILEAWANGSVVTMHREVFENHHNGTTASRGWIEIDGKRVDDVCVPLGAQQVLVEKYGFRGSSSFAPQHGGNGYVDGWRYLLLPSTTPPVINMYSNRRENERGMVYVTSRRIGSDYASVHVYLDGIDPDSRDMGGVLAKSDSVRLGHVETRIDWERLFA